MAEGKSSELLADDEITAPVCIMMHDGSRKPQDKRDQARLPAERVALVASHWELELIEVDAGHL